MNPSLVNLYFQMMANRRGKAKGMGSTATTTPEGMALPEPDLAQWYGLPARFEEPSQAKGGPSMLDFDGQATGYAMPESDPDYPGQAKRRKPSLADLFAAFMQKR